ncbi:MAG: hypothetical protein C0593_06610 [Marinilabiliales bacterium]|nr:MAG: hypothetical protein C0593_06610 [Marinilabiliales bacterium]
MKKGTKPQLAEFIKEDLTISRGGPVFSPDGSRIYYYSERAGGYFKLHNHQYKYGWH